MSESGRAITDARLRDGAVSVAFEDGSAEAFHFLWLRDNCPCPDCRHPQTAERTFDLLTVPADVTPKAVSVEPAGALTVVWEVDGHESRYDAGWLRAHGYSAARRQGRRDRVRLWDAASGRDLPTFSHTSVMRDDAALLAWLRAVKEVGVVLLRDVPGDDLEVTRVARRIAYEQPTNFGAYFDVVSAPNPNNNAYTALALGCHTDLPNWTVPPGFQLLHCLQNDAAGGDSLFVDGFQVAEVLRREHPQAFELLTQVPLDFRFVDDVADIRYRAPAIALDERGEVVQIRFNPGILGTLDVAWELMEATYRAYRLLAELIRSTRFEVRLSLAPGELVMFDNHRVLHGRTAFDPTRGGRHLQGCYVGVDELASRVRVLERARQGATDV